MKKTFLFLTVATASLVLPACSTVANGSNQLVKFETSNASGSVEGANCDIKGGSKGMVNKTVTTPGEVQIPRSKKMLNINCSKPGYMDGTKQVTGRVEGTTAGNIILGGVVGLGVDAASGALYKYPDTITITMEEQDGS